MATANGIDKVESLLLSEIEVNPKWNTRSDLGESSGGPDEKTGLDGLVASISAKGQDTPVIVKPNKDGAKKPFFLVSGNRRFEAIRRIAEKAGDKAPTIKATIRKMTDLEAFELNVRENTVRDDLTGADLVFGVGRIINEYKKENKKFTQATIADMLGLSQAYVGKLAKISEYGKQELIEKWRHAVGVDGKGKLTVDQMHKVASAPPGEQNKLYEELVRPGEDDGDPKRGKGAWIKTAKKSAAYVGTILGKLARAELIETTDELFHDENVRLLVKFRDKATDNQMSQIVNACEKAFTAAYEADEDDGEEVPAKKGAKRAKGEARAEN